MGGRKDGWTEGRKEGWWAGGLAGRKDGWMDGQTVSERRGNWADARMYGSKIDERATG